MELAQHVAELIADAIQAHVNAVWGTVPVLGANISYFVIIEALICISTSSQVFDIPSFPL